LPTDWRLRCPAFAGQFRRGFLMEEGNAVSADWGLDWGGMEEGMLPTDLHGFARIGACVAQLLPVNSGAVF